LSESLQSSLRGRGRGRVAELISQHFESFTPSERQIADRLLGDPVTSGFATATELAKELGISASTVVRFAQSLGFGGWLELQGALKHERSEWQRLVDLAPGEGHFLSEFVNTELDNLRFLLGQDDQLDAAAQILADADQVWLLGNRASSHVTTMAHQFLTITRPGVRLLSGDVRTTPETLLDAAPGNAALVLSMARYAQATTDIGRHLAKVMPLVLLTDEFASPLLRFAAVHLRFGTASVTSWKSSTAAFSLMQALVMAIARKTPDARDRLHRAEQLWSEFGTY